MNPNPQLHIPKPDYVQQLEDRVKALEDLLGINGDEIILTAGSSKLIITKTDLRLSANKIAIQAAGDVLIKGSKIKQN